MSGLVNCAFDYSMRMVLLSHEKVIALCREYGRVVGAEALAELLGYEVRHARRFIANPPKTRMNRENYDRAVENISRMMTAIEASREREAQLDRVMERIGEYTPSDEGAATSSVADPSQEGEGLEAQANVEATESAIEKEEADRRRAAKRKRDREGG